MSNEILNIRKPLAESIYPDNFPDHAKDTIARLLGHASVVGVLYFYEGELKFHTTSIHIAQVLGCKVPLTIRKVRSAIKEITAMINKINPIVDRLLDDESIEGIIMANEEGAPIFKKVHSLSATTCGKQLKQLGSLCHVAVKDLNVFDELIVVRMETENYEIMFAPNPEFNVIVIQHYRRTMLRKKI